MSDFHGLSIKSCLKELKTSVNGLTNEEAAKRLKKYGPNKLEEEKPLSRFAIFVSQLKSPLIYVLLVAAAVSFLLSEYVDAGVIFGAVVLNTIIGFFQENKANRALSKLRKMVEHKALVLRDGRETVVDSGQLVVGDIIILQAGNRILADGRIIEANDLRASEANLTGESIPSSKSTGKIPKGAALADQENMVFGSTIIVRGNGKAIITAVGAKSEIGKIANLVKTTTEEKTPLQLRLLRLSKFLGLAIILVCLFVAGVGIWQGRDFFEMFIVSIAIAVAAIPEGLAVSVTVILVLGMQRILKRKALTRKLVAAETLGSTTVICADKTGTLTEGKMEVSKIVIGEKEFGLETLGAKGDNQEAEAVSLALKIGMMCNDAIAEIPEDKSAEEKIIGAPTEVALLSAARRAGLDREKLLKIEPKIAELPFSSEKKFMITLHKG
ncbi:MAG: HAD-IC family P-type ATPase, partial [Patescibacteria group bacterium]|nr:HAD-IC family P-type ATPase [Patescibacteria group bacterium]